MNGPQFFQTHMGQRFFEGTLPQLVREVGRLASGVERLAAAMEAAPPDVRKEAPRSSGASASEAKNGKEQSE